MALDRFIRLLEQKGIFLIPFPLNDLFLTFYHFLKGKIPCTMRFKIQQQRICDWSHRFELTSQTAAVLLCISDPNFRPFNLLRSVYAREDA